MAATDQGARSPSGSPSPDRQRQDSNPSASGVVIGEDGLARCPWAVTKPLLTAYHDEEWGVPVRDERGLYERICLESFQAGLSWLTILTKRSAFRAAFADFDPEVVAGYGPAEVDLLLQDAKIVRNRAKIEAAISNAQATVAMRAHGGLGRLIWEREPDRPLCPRTVADVPTVTPESKRLSRVLRASGFAFVGPTTAQALMEAIGMVDPHLVGCHRQGISRQQDGTALTP